MLRALYTRSRDSLKLPLQTCYHIYLDSTHDKLQFDISITGLLNRILNIVVLFWVTVPKHYLANQRDFKIVMSACLLILVFFSYLKIGLFYPTCVKGILHSANKYHLYCLKCTNKSNYLKCLPYPHSVVFCLQKWPSGAI